MASLEPINSQEISNQPSSSYRPEDEPSLQETQLSNLLQQEQIIGMDQINQEEDAGNGLNPATLENNNNNDNTGAGENSAKELLS